MGINYEVYKPIQTRLNNMPSNPAGGTLFDISVFNQEHGDKIRRDNLMRSGMGSTPDPLIDRIQTRQAEQIVKAADTATLQRTIQNISASKYTREAAINELQNRGLKPPTATPSTPSFPTTNSTSAQQATQQALQQIGLPSTSTGGLRDFAKGAAPTVLGMALDRFVVEPLATAFSKNITTPFANKVDEALGLRPDPKAKELYKAAQAKLDNAIAQRKARNAENARLNNYADPITGAPPFAGGQSPLVGYKIEYEWSQSGAEGLVFNWTAATQQGNGAIGAVYSTRKEENDTATNGSAGNGVMIVEQAHTSSPLKYLALHGFQFNGYPIAIRNIRVSRLDNQPDTGGNLQGAVIDANPNKKEPVPSPDTSNFSPNAVTGISEPLKDLLAGTWGKAQKPFSGLPFADPEDEEKPNLNFAPNPNNSNSNTAPVPKLRTNPNGGFPQIAATGAAAGTALGMLTNLSKPSFTARPYVAGKSDPSEQFEPRDTKTGLTRKELEQQWKDQNQAIQDRAKAGERAAAANDAAKIREQLNNLSDAPNPANGGLSPRQQAEQNYLNQIKGDAIREEAYRNTANNTKPLNSTNTTPVSTNNPTPTDNNVGQTVAQLLGLTALVAALKVGSDALVNASLGNTAKINEIAQNTMPTEQKNNAKAAVCESMQPQQCGYEGVKAATTDATNPIKEGVAANGGALASLLNLLTTVWEFLQNRLGKVLNILNNTVVDRTLAVMNLATNIHNAAMLTRDIGETLGSVVDNALSLVNLKFTNSEGQQVQFTDSIASNFRAVLVSVLGAENYVSLVLAWQKANTIYHSAMGVLNTTQSMLDPISSAVEYGMENVSKIGNSLKEDGVVSENSYPAMDETIRARRVNRFERLNDTLEGAENIASNLSSVTSSAVSIKEDYKQLREDAKDLKDKATAFSTADSEARAAFKAELPTDITPITLAPAPAEDEN